eukprot:11124434-Ditylum_brightwellii.AAC.1
MVTVIKLEISGIVISLQMPYRQLKKNVADEKSSSKITRNSATNVNVKRKIPKVWTKLKSQRLRKKRSSMTMQKKEGGNKSMSKVVDIHVKFSDSTFPGSPVTNVKEQKSK